MMALPPATDSPEPAGAFAPAVTSQPRGQRALIAALVVAVVVLAGIAGVTGYLLLQRNDAASPPSARPAAPSPAVVPSPPAVPAVEVPGLAPFLGKWGGGNAGGSIEIDANGSGSWKFSDRSTCPDAPMIGCGIIGIADFTLTSVANGTATGGVTASSNPDHDPLGEPVTIVLGTGWQGKGTVLSVSISKMRGWFFCNATSPHFCAEG